MTGTGHPKLQFPFLDPEQFAQPDRETELVSAWLLERDFIRFRGLRRRLIFRTAAAVALFICLGFTAFVMQYRLITVLLFSLAVLILAAAGIPVSRRVNFDHARRIMKLNFRLLLVPYGKNCVVVDPSGLLSPAATDTKVLDADQLESMESTVEELIRFLDTENGCSHQPADEADFWIRERLERLGSHLKPQYKLCMSKHIATESFRDLIPCLLLNSNPVHQPDTTPARAGQDLADLLTAVVGSLDDLEKNQALKVSDRISAFELQMDEIIKRCCKLTKPDCYRLFRDSLRRIGDISSQNYYCPECNTDSARSGSEENLDINTRLIGAGRKGWRCPLCRKVRVNPVPRHKLIDDIFQPLASLLDETGSEKSEDSWHLNQVKKLNGRLPALEKMNPLWHARTNLAEFQRWVVDSCEQTRTSAMRSDWTACLEKLLRASSLIRASDQELHQLSRTWLMDLALPEPVEVLVPIYISEHTVNGEEQIGMILPLVKREPGVGNFNLQDRIQENPLFLPFRKYLESHLVNLAREHRDRLVPFSAVDAVKHLAVLTPSTFRSKRKRDLQKYAGMVTGEVNGGR